MNAEWRRRNAEKKKDIDRQYYLQNREEFSRKGAIYYAENKKQMRDRNREWCERNADHLKEMRRLKRAHDGDRIREKRRQHYRENKAIYIAHARRREAEKLQATLSGIPAEAFIPFYEEAARLTAETGIVHHVDHIHPLRGKNFCGLHVPWNLQVIPAIENLKKSNSLPPELARLSIPA